MDAFTEMLHGWQTFYFTVGGASAAMIGLMFVALSLGVSLVSNATREDVETYASPSIFHFISVLLIACVVLAPSYTPAVFALVTLTGGLLGLARSIIYVRQLFQAAKHHQDFTTSDWLLQIILPTLVYVVIIAAAVCFALEQWSLGFSGLWISSITLILCAILNTWSLFVWIMSQKTN